MICCIVLYAFGKMLNRITMEVPLYDYQVYTFYSVGPPLRVLGTGVSTERIERGAYRPSEKIRLSEGKSGSIYITCTQRRISKKSGIGSA